MIVLNVRNVHEALPRGLKLLDQIGIERESRNGPVVVAPGPVATVYERPLERVIFWPERDANPFFHLYESLWMLAGRNDVAGPSRYAKNMANYSDDGRTFHGAYGHRWRNHFGITSTADSGIGEYEQWEPIDQLEKIAQQLRENRDDRRSVLEMWDAEADLGRSGKDLPCNLTATFQRGNDGALNLVVFCRSNDIIWGAYGANAVHFSILLEYMANWIGCSVGTYTQISVNYHAYVDKLQPLLRLRPDSVGFVDNPYIAALGVRPVPMIGSYPHSDDYDRIEIDRRIEFLLHRADTEFADTNEPDDMAPWTSMVYHVLLAHRIYKMTGSAKEACYTLDGAPSKSADWVLAARQWFERRMK